MKNFSLVLSALSLAMLASSCGGNNNKGSAAAQQLECQNTYGQPVQCGTPGAYPRNNPAGYPQGGYPGYPQVNVQCAQGQFKLRNQCVVAADLNQACMIMRGGLVNLSNRTVCRMERQVEGYTYARAPYCTGDSYLSSGRAQPRISFNSVRRISGDRFLIRETYLGEGCVSYALTANTLPTETLYVSGRVTPKNENNSWSLTLKKGYTILDSASAGMIMSDQGENFSMKALAGVVGATVVPGYPATTGVQTPGVYAPAGYPSTGYGYGYGSSYGAGYGTSYGAGYGYSEPIVLEAMIKGRNDILIRLSATSCEDGAGNAYPCY